MGILDFVKLKNGENVNLSRVQRFEKISEGKTKEEIRVLEKTMLEPEKIKPYVYDAPGKSPVENRTITVVFDSEEDLLLFRNYFEVRDYRGLNLRGSQSALMMNILYALRDGDITYDQKSKRVCIKGEEFTPKSGC
jgi:hypothetical protein